MSFPMKLNWRCKLFLDKFKGVEPNITWIDFIKIVLERHEISFEVQNVKNLLLKSVNECSDGFYEIKLNEGRIYWPIENGLDGIISEILFQINNDHPHNYFQWNVINSNDVVFDLGACEGYFSLKCLPNSRHTYLFEPIQKICEALKRRLMHRFLMDLFLSTN